MELSSPTRNSIPVWTLCFDHWMAIVLSASFLFGWYFGVVREINLAVALFFLILCSSCYLGGALVLGLSQYLMFRPRTIRSRFCWDSYCSASPFSWPRWYRLWGSNSISP